MSGTEWTLLVLYLAVVGVLAIYGFHRYQMVYLYYRNRSNIARPPRRFAEDELPSVTVQLPCYNEMYVVERLIDAVAALDYPRHLLQVQVLDDSTDETTAIARARVEYWRQRGLEIELRHRTDRRGFKAGALAEGLRHATGELIAIFDADFVPPPDFLRRTVDHFTDPEIGMVQARWEHLNRDYSLLTQVQSILLDGHFQIEQTARNRSGRFFNFNGTAGIWRRQAIEDAGGWQHDTLTEDLDISFRAQLRGWRFVFLPEVTAPAELPADINAFKSQQHRWTKGAVQCARKLLGSIWGAEQVPLKAKIEATYQLTMNLAYVLMVLLSILMLPALTIRFEQTWLTYLLIDVPFFVLATTSVFSFYVASQREVYPHAWLQRLRYVPLVVSVGIGMCLSNAKAVLEGLLGKPSEFVRTPKHGIQGRAGSWRDKRYAAMKSLLPWVELAFGIYFAVIFGIVLWERRFLMLPFVGLFLFGFLYVAYLSFAHHYGRPAEPEPRPVALLPAPPREELAVV
ncbi:MAG: glucosyltransferase [Planctomycetota bacterium]|nr:MAG: glucosyltransferase [Planctomycetota bacterium]